MACPSCKKPKGYGLFPGNQSLHILGGMIHFIDWYNANITSPKHIFPPQVYLPLIFACSNYETLLSDLVREIMDCYGRYIGRLGRKIIWSETLAEYDKKANENLFKLLTGTGIQKALKQSPYKKYFQELEIINQIRNKIVHGNEIDNHEQGFAHVNDSINFLLESVKVFAYLHNEYVCKFRKNVDYATILNLGKTDSFTP